MKRLLTLRKLSIYNGFTYLNNTKRKGIKMKYSIIYYEALTMRKHGFTLEQALKALLLNK